MSDAFRSISLKNGLTVQFFDQTNRYFGDFHRICIQVLVELPEYYVLPDGVKREDVKLERTLEKMGVPSISVEKETLNLIEAFLVTSKSYLEKEEFPQQLLRKAVQPKRKPALLFSR